MKWSDIGADHLFFLKALRKVARILRGLGLPWMNRFGERVLTRLVGNRLSVRIDGFVLRGSVEHRHYLRVLREGRLDSFMAALFVSFVKPTMVVLDIGAHLGRYSLLAARQVGPGGKVFAFEPHPRNYPLLVLNTKASGLGDRVITVAKAVSDKAGTTTFYLDGYNPSGSSLFAYRRGLEQAIVECISVDDYLGESVPVDVVKIDVEGAELRTLQGMRRTLARAKSHLTMFVEWHPDKLRAAGESAGALVEYLRKLGFQVMVIDEKKRSLSPVKVDAAPAEYYDLLCVRGSSAHGSLFPSVGGLTIPRPR